MSWSRDTAARTLFQECRGEPVEGQKAVSHVILNRQKTGRWGNSLATVCLWPHQFSGWSSANDPNFKAACGLPDDDPTLFKMHNVLDVASVEADFTGGATHYYATYIAPPSWTDGAIYCGQFGKQKFYRGVK